MANIKVFKKRMFPEIDNSRCRDCGACLEVAPEVFVRHSSGFYQVLDMDRYPQDQVDEAIALCPADCIAWQEEE